MNALYSDPTAGLFIYPGYLQRQVRNSATNEFFILKNVDVVSWTNTFIEINIGGLSCTIYPSNPNEFLQILLSAIGQ